MLIGAKTKLIDLFILMAGQPINGILCVVLRETCSL